MKPIERRTLQQGQIPLGQTGKGLVARGEQGEVSFLFQEVGQVCFFHQRQKDPAVQKKTKLYPGLNRNQWHKCNNGTFLVMPFWFNDNTQKNVGCLIVCTLIPQSILKKNCSPLTWTLHFLSGPHTWSFPLVSTGSSWDEGLRCFLPYCLWSDRNSQCTRPAIRIRLQVKCRETYIPSQKKEKMDG